MEDKTGEILEKKTKAKEIYFYYDKGNKVISKEVLLTKDIIIHYPRYFKYDFKEKYKNIKTITFIGFKGFLPVGVNKSANKGYGFTQITSQFADYLDKILHIKNVIIEKNGNQKIDKKLKSIIINESILISLNKSLKILKNKQKEEKMSFMLGVLKPFFPQEIKLPEKQYKPDELALTINNWDNSIDKLSKNDKNALKELFQKLSLNNDFFDFDSISETKQILETQYLNSCLVEFTKLLKQPKDSPALEKKWQLFFKEKNWIFTYVFSQPIVLHKEEAYVGGKNINNTNGKFTDFLVKNKLSNNVSFLEIKTHRAKLLVDKPYRGDDVFSVSDVFSGCISQVLNQRDNFQKEYYQFIGKSKEKIMSFNPRCIILIGCLSDMTEKQRNCFELFRSNSKDVEIITYDELFEKIKQFQNLMKRK